MSIFDKWNASADLSGLQKDVKEAQSKNGGDYVEVPYGDYEVKIDRMELKESKKGDPMVSIWFTILNGKFKNSRLFVNQVITQGFQIHIVNELLRCMDSGLNIEFEDYNQYNNLLMDVAEKCDELGLEFALKYEETKRGYPKYTITEVFEAE